MVLLNGSYTREFEVDLQAMAYFPQDCNCKATKKGYSTVSVSITIHDTERGSFTEG